ncbi:MAG: HlyD family efflux transporter periplasmic adaptor subunit [Opitutus sp.]|nr:HlyD family efflux transporter periplasmic adaptor subunit [Opitutus sp.]
MSWLVLAAAGCARQKPAGYQGYLEGELVYVAAPLAGRLETLATVKGARVAAGTPLFTLERAAELAGQREAADRLRAAQARLEDLKKGARPSELAALEARLEQARSAAELSQRELARQETLFKSGASPANDLDRARLTHERNTRAIDEVAAQLGTAQLGGRTDAIAAATAAKERTDWNVEQKSQSPAQPALVYDTLFHPGEFVSAGSPVVALLPPENLKVRCFVPEADFAALQPGDAVRVIRTGAPNLDARINYLSPRPEFTPPVLYNRENRAKLVFMVEAVFDPAAARDLHPGQPVEIVRLAR